MQSLREEVRVGGRHRWPDDAPPSSISKPQACALCGLVRKAVQAHQTGHWAGRRRYWFSRDGKEFVRHAGPCVLAKATKRLSVIIQEVRHAA